MRSESVLLGVLEQFRDCQAEDALDAIETMYPDLKGHFQIVRVRGGAAFVTLKPDAPVLRF